MQVRVTRKGAIMIHRAVAFFEMWDDGFFVCCNVAAVSQQMGFI